MSHLHDFMGVTGPRKILTFVTGPFLEIIELPWPRYLGSLFGFSGILPGFLINQNLWG